MIFNSNICIAYKNGCGKYDVEKISLFEMKKIETLFKDFKVKINKNKEVVFTIKCSVCGNYHIYKYNVNDFINREMIMGGCEVLGMPLFFIGDCDKITQRVNKYTEINSKLRAMI